MKNFIFAAFLGILVLTALPLRAQITLEDRYVNPGDIGLAEVDSGEWKYVQCRNDSVIIYNMDHSIERQIRIPWAADAWAIVVAKRLFTTDTAYSYISRVAEGGGYFSGIRVFKEDGTILFSRDSCYLGTNSTAADNTIGLNRGLASGIKQTPNGAKMIITAPTAGAGGVPVEVYSLPGRLPGSSQMLTVGGDPSNPNYALASPAAYPNPSIGRVRIAYDLPVGVTSGEIVLTTSDGREVKRYHITNAFSDLLIEEGDLPAGSYFYKVVTARGESPVQKIIHE